MRRDFPLLSKPMRPARVLLFAVLLTIAAALLLWQGWLLAELPPSRVEIVCEAGETALRGAFAEAAREPSLRDVRAVWEKDRLVLTGVDIFTAQRMRTALRRAGLADVCVLDYAWAEGVLEQSKLVWRMAGAAALVWLFARCAATLLRREYQAAQCALAHSCPVGYLQTHSVRLLAELTALSAGCLVSLALLQWLWRTGLTLPTGLLPTGSVFDAAHYQSWHSGAFPADALSAYARRLEQMLKQSYLLSAGASITLCLAAGSAAPTQRSHKTKKTG